MKLPLIQYLSCSWSYTFKGNKFYANKIYFLDNNHEIVNFMKSSPIPNDNPNKTPLIEIHGMTNIRMLDILVKKDKGMVFVTDTKLMAPSQFYSIDVDCDDDTKLMLKMIL